MLAYMLFQYHLSQQSWHLTRHILHPYNKHARHPDDPNAPLENAARHGSVNEIGKIIRTQCSFYAPGWQRNSSCGLVHKNKVCKRGALPRQSIMPSLTSSFSLFTSPLYLRTLQLTVNPLSLCSSHFCSKIIVYRLNTMAFKCLTTLVAGILNIS